MEGGLGSTIVPVASPSSAEPQTVLGPRVDQDGIFCLPHWVALNMRGLPTHPQAKVTNWVLLKETLESHHLKLEGPQVIA